MPIVNSIAANADEMKTWRRYLHQHPEMGLDCFKTAAFVVDKLREFGVTDIHEGIARSGVVAIIEGREPGKTIGLRADMDALPMQDMSGTEHASTVPGMAHTCGHDGHTTMLLGAAKYLAETRNFAGRVALLFQPAEENDGGGRIMVEEGVMDRFNIEEVYGIHNMPGDALGAFGTNHGAMLAGVDEFTIEITGKGGHAAQPQNTVDPVVAAASITMALQTILGRNLSALDRVVVSVTQIHTGTAMNIVPEVATLNGTVRYYDPAAQAIVKARMSEIIENQSRSFGCSSRFVYEEGYPPTVNHPAQASFAADVARDVVGADKVNENADPIMPGEDFSYMLLARPGAYLFLGQGDTPVCHHPEYDFKDEIAPIGASFFARLVERALPAT
ncbi:amidohydrolase [Sagittula sp. NFXS13]|uniref:M20 aminoacylase family protein n=1 Tax=Sagittula sp. NFXS13 TaxID=2819095 RepID=UPI0032DFB187